MSQRFNPRMEEMKQNNPASYGYEPETQIGEDDLYYPTYGNVRHLCCCWMDGKKFFLNYAYLISAEYDAAEGAITLAFSTHSVVIKGVNLQSVFFRIMGQQIRLLQCTDARYNSIGGDRAIVNSIQITANTSG
jgi:hypothetical protein